MNIKATLSDALVSPLSNYTPEDFLGHIYTLESDDNTPLLQLLSGGTVNASFPFSFDVRSMDCFMLLYTRAGYGKLLVNNHVYSLIPSHLLLLDCRERFRLDIAIEPWQYDVLFITGNTLSYYYDLLPEKGPVLTPITDYAETTLCIEKLLKITDTDNILSALKASELINTIFTNCIAGQIEKSTPTSQPASYLHDLKSLLDNSFEKTYTLDTLEQRYHISKYHLCREFSAAFGMPPFQYLNHRRIHIAEHLLLTTDLKIHEIGSKVGIDNTNHFISLFRKYNGMTPLEYKRRMTL